MGSSRAPNWGNCTRKNLPASRGGGGGGDGRGRRVLAGRPSHKKLHGGVYFSPLCSLLKDKHAPYRTPSRTGICEFTLGRGGGGLR